MWIVKLLSLLGIVFALYAVIDVFVPAIKGEAPFTVWRWVFKGKDYDKEVEDYNKSQEDSKDS